MARIAGFKTIKNAQGKITAVQLSMKHHANILEDMILAQEMEKAKKGPSVPWEEAKKRIDKKFGFKD